MSELKPCPFCGGVARIEKDISCYGCGATIDSREAWNRRAPDPEKWELMEQLAESLEEEHESRVMQTGGHKFRDRCQTCALLRRYEKEKP